jgi:hypothetical protein
VLTSFVQSANDVDAYQFGFTAGHSTSLCTSVFKRIVDYYKNLGSHVFVCSIDFTKAFDLISYWKLLDKLLDDDCNPAVIKLLAFWYCHQCACVRWHNVTSQFFGLGNGTRQGGVLSPKLFARYIRELLTDIVNSGVGCNVGGIMLRATGKSRLHGKHGNCVFERKPCFLPVSVKCRVFGNFDVFSVVN